MKKLFVACFMIIVMTMTISIHTHAEKLFNAPQADSKEVQLQDMLMLFLLPHIDQAVAKYYAQFLIEKPIVYPYEVDITKIKRSRFRGYEFLITLEVSPVVGPHIGVGKDLITFQIDPTLPKNIKSISYEHIKTYDLPPNWEHIIRKTLN
ncbi:DUF3888 domain-containing protein [Paenibacillus segetis]|uniref:DUF3888 domain-containing protein n=1 Tax=Paenibacillus segetis TaxID=1325360 RepID=A0ABQ1YEC3_9BACL|nr:DUF3888 domain-containing protein [Paenibacillus segetis]GGH22178.1 hypothetical protein GCM10008013_20510 [Paenibacillus segetis]